MTGHSESYVAPIVAYIAVQFKGISDNYGWPKTEWGERKERELEAKQKAAGGTNIPSKDIADYLPVDTSAGAANPAAGPPSVACYAPLMAVKWPLKHEYAGGSTNGPRTAVRPTVGEIEVEREIDPVSPIFMEYAFSGKLLSYVHIYYGVVELDTEGEEGSRSMTAKASTVSWFVLQNCLLSGYTYATNSRDELVLGYNNCDHYEVLGLTFSKISFQSGTTVKSWSSKTDSDTST